MGLPFEEISASAIEAAGSALTQGVLMPTVIQAVSQCIVPKCARNLVQGWGLGLGLGLGLKLRFRFKVQDEPQMYSVRL